MFPTFACEWQLEHEKTEKEMKQLIPTVDKKRILARANDYTTAISYLFTRDKDWCTLFISEEKHLLRITKRR